MSTKRALESIFSHLYVEPEPEPPPAAPAAAEEAPEAAAAEGVAEAPDEGEAEPAPAPAPEAASEPDEYALAIDAIRSRLDTQVHQAQAAAEHLVSERERAARADVALVHARDFDHGKQHRKTGLPQQRWALELDEGMLETQGLLHPQHLMEAVHAARAAGSAPPPEGSVLQDEASTRAPPHYMGSTKTFDVKAAEMPLTASVRSVRKLRDAQRLQREKDKAEGAEAAAVADAAAEATKGQRLEKKKKKAFSGDPSQEDRLMQRMQAPLHFLRNPRVVLPPRRPASGALLRQSKVPQPGAFIHVSPQEVIFTDYEPGGVYEIPVKLCNVSGCSRRLRVLPPTSRFFSVCLLAYPSDGGFLAPGMHAELSVRFAPDSLADYSDFILVQTEQDSFPLPVYAKRSPPNLTLPATLDCGYCFVGGEESFDFAGQNLGGAGRFMLMSKTAWAAGERNLEEPLRVGHFEISPCFLDLQPADHFRLSVTFRPDVAGPEAEPLILICDNCQTRELRLVGTGCTASVQIESVDGRPPYHEHNGKPLQETLDFGDVSLFAEVEQSVQVLNTTPLPFEFEWRNFQIPQPRLNLSRLRSMPPPLLRSTELGELLPALSERFPYSIEPTSGTLEAGGTASFIVRYRPSLCTLSAGALILAPQGVPEASLLMCADEGGAAEGGPSAAEGRPSPELGLQLLGRGVGETLQLEPAAVLCRGGSALGVGVPRTLTLTNPNMSSRSWRWLREQPTGASAALEVELRPEAGELAPGESIELQLTLRGEAPGLLCRTLLLGVAPHGDTLQLPVQLEVLGPQLRLGPAVLDFGLLPLGDAKSISLSLYNHSDTDAPWMLVPAPLPRVAGAEEAAEAQARGLGRVERGAGLSGAELAAQIPEEQLDWACCAHEQQLSHLEIDEIEEVRVRMHETLSAAHRAAGITLSESFGLLPARGSLQVELTLDAAAAQSLRRTLECKVLHGESQFVGVRSEVVQRRACLNTSTLALGVSYVKVAVTRMLTLTNLTRIATDFEWVLPDTSAQGLTLEIAPEKGTLGPAEDLPVGIRLLSKEPGEVNVLLGIKMHGGTVPPIGLRVTSRVQGLTLSYEVLTPDDPRVHAPPPPELPHVPPPEVDEPLPALHFGLDAPVFEQRTRVLLIRNHSAVPAHYSIAAASYPAPELHAELAAPPDVSNFALAASTLKALKTAEIAAQRAAAAAASETTSSLSVRSAGSKTSTRRLSSTGGRGSVAGVLPKGRPTLGDGHERSQPFFSESGVNFSAQQLLKRREAALLAAGRGAAFECTPAQGYLPPWGQALVAVNAHHNMWGRYEDSLVCQVEGLADVALEMLLGVCGSPVRLHDATLGLSFRSTPPLLSWTPVPTGTPAVRKSIRLLNYGPAPVQLEWRLCAPPEAERPAGVSIALKENGSVGMELQPLPLRSLDAAEGADPLAPHDTRGDAAAPDVAFTIEPHSATIPAGGERRFSVCFANKANGNFEAMLVAHMRHGAMLPLPLGGQSDCHPELRLRLLGDTLTPKLDIGGYEGGKKDLKFRVSPVHSKEHPSYTRTLSLRNPNPSTLHFSLSVSAPFVLQHIQSASQQHALLGERRVLENSQLVLPPQEAIQAVISYVPSRRRRRAAASAAESGADTDGDDAMTVVSGMTAATGMTGATQNTSAAARHAAPDPQHAYLAHRTTDEGALSVVFASGDEQSFPLVACITAPYVELSAPELRFGPLHIDCTQELELGMSNPTEAEAAWALKHIPLAPERLSPRERKELAAAGVQDRPEVFHFNAESGVLPARGGMIPQVVPLVVRFVPDAPGNFSSSFIIKVRKGQAARLTVSAEATLLEEHYAVIKPEKHLQLMLPGALQ